MTLTPGKLILAKDHPADADVKAYVAAVEAADELDTPGIGALEPAVVAAYDNFIVGCKADGIWDAIKASCILAGARTLSGALVPLVGTAPTNFNFVAADYDRKTGLKGNSTTKYLNSNRNNNADPRDSQHLAVYVTQLRTVGARFYLASNYQVTGTSSISDIDSRSRSSASESVNGNVLGLVANSRSLAASYIYRSNGVNSLKTRSSDAPGSSDIHVFGGSNPQAFRSNARLAFYSIGEALDLALLDTRVSTLISDLGAAIP